MKRGDDWWVNYEAAVGGEVRRERPAVIASNDAANMFLNGTSEELGAFLSSRGY